jgi:drug/metabolite transporter (DMT)-like permease
MRLFVLTAVTMTAFAGNSVLNRMAVGGGLIDSVGFAAVRVLAGAALLGALLAARRWRTGRAVWPGRAGRLAGVLSLTVYLFGFSLAYAQLDAGTGALILFGMVQVTLFAGAVALNEPVPRARWVGAGLAFAGLVLLLFPADDGTVSARHAGLMALAGIGWGAYALSARGTSDPMGATAWNFILSVPFAGAAWLAMPLPACAAPAGVGLAVLSGAVTSGLGYVLWYAVLPQLGATRAAVAQLTVPLITAAGGLVLLAERPDWRFAAASLLILGGVVVAVRGGRS